MTPSQLHSLTAASSHDNVVRTAIYRVAHVFLYSSKLNEINLITGTENINCKLVSNVFPTDCINNFIYLMITTEHLVFYGWKWHGNHSRQDVMACGLF